jgi:hypothetical protein
MVKRKRTYGQTTIYNIHIKSKRTGSEQYYFIFEPLFILFSISAIFWRPVLVVEEVGVPGENH